MTDDIQINDKGIFSYPAHPESCIKGRYYLAFQFDDEKEQVMMVPEIGIDEGAEFTFSLKAEEGAGSFVFSTEVAGGHEFKMRLVKHE